MKPWNPWKPLAADGLALPSAAEIRLAPWSAFAAPCLVAIAGLALFLSSLRGVDLGAMNSLGLISVLPVASLAGTGLLVLAFVLMLGQRRAQPVVLGLMLVAIVLCLDGVAAIAEPEPRFATAYQIAGFVEYISRTGHTAPGIDAYFSWPGFFALTAFLEGVIGKHDLIPVLRWWPTVIDVLCLVPLALIMRSLRVNWRAQWFALLLFSVGNWVGQDYFSPQSFNYLLYLTFVAILLTWFGTGAATARAEPPRPRPRPRHGHGSGSGSRSRSAGSGGSGGSGGKGGAGRLARLRWLAFGRLTPGELPSRQVSSGERVILLLLLIAIFLTSTVSHQLTPFLMLATCAALVLARRCTLTGLPVLLGVILIAWISFGTVAYWSGHLSGIFGGVGHLGANVSSSVGGRLTGATPEHQHALYVRVGFAALLMAMAGLGLLRRRVARLNDRALLVLICVPFLSVGLQSYGGEIGLRVYLFALPAASVLAACLFFPDGRPDGLPDVLPDGRPGRHSWLALVSAGIVGVVFAGLFFGARYGNEAFEQTPPGELTAMNYVYAHDSDGLRLAWLSDAPTVNVTPQMPWEYRDIEKVSYLPVQAPRDPAAVASLVASLRHLGPGTYLIAMRTQSAYLEQAASYPAGWGAGFRASIAAAAGVRVAFADSDATIYTLRWPPGTPRPSLLANPHAAPVKATAWTPVGLVVLGLLLVLLITRELARLRQPARRRFTRLLTLASAPLLVLLLAVVAERFAVLS